MTLRTRPSEQSPAQPAGTDPRGRSTDPLALIGAVLLCGSLILSACSDSTEKGSDPVDSREPTTTAVGQVDPEEPVMLAAIPPMGWNSWNQVRCHDLTEDVVKRAADAIVEHGLDDVGYEYVVVDDCWQAPAHDASGELVANPETFPSGMKALSDYIHDKGLKFGLYLVPGSTTCAMTWDGYQAEGIGSLGHERQDAEMLEAIEADYLKYDWCDADVNDGLERVAAFTQMRDELRRLDRPIVYSISEYGKTQPWTWAPGIANLWRTTGDITPHWLTVAGIIDSQADLADYAGPGGWNDPDMLQVGNGDMTPDEIRSHVGMWAMLAAPLMIGTDLDNLSPEVLDALSNEEVVEIDQDPLGQQARRVRVGEGEVWARTEVWSRPLDDGGYAVALFNKTDAPVDMAATLEEVGVPNGTWTVRDASNRADLPSTDHQVSSTVPAHGLVILRLEEE
ncbi:MAG: glycoside hydrolase family 27 protein [Microthrixaceae bacterium]